MNLEQQQTEQPPSFRLDVPLHDLLTKSNAIAPVLAICAIDLGKRFHEQCSQEAFLSANRAMVGKLGHGGNGVRDRESFARFDQAR